MVKLWKTCLEIKILLGLATDLPKKPIIGLISDFWPCLHIHYPWLWSCLAISTKEIANKYFLRKSIQKTWIRPVQLPHGPEILWRENVMFVRLFDPGFGTCGSCQTKSWWHYTKKGVQVAAHSILCFKKTRGN